LSGRAGIGIEDHDGLAKRVRDAGEIAVALGLGGHEARHGAGVAVAYGLKAQEELAVRFQHVRNIERPAERSTQVQMIVGGLGRVLAGERKRAGVQRGIVHDEIQVAAIPGARAFADVSDGAAFDAVARAAVEHEGVGGVGVGIDGGGGDSGGRGIGRCVYVGALKTGLRIGGRGRRFLGGRFGVGGRGGGRCGLEGRCRHGDASGGEGWRGGRRGCLQLIERQQLQIEFRAGGFRGDCNILLERFEAEHLDFDVPDAVGEVWERIEPLRVRDRDLFLIALRGRDGGAGNRQAAELDLAMVLRRRQPEDG
jgi:hypothetical protein